MKMFMVIDEQQMPMTCDSSTNAPTKFSLPMTFCQITRESDVRTFTGLNGTEIFQAVFNLLKKKAAVMTYWDDSKKTFRLKKRLSSVQVTERILCSLDYDVDESLLPMVRSGPSHKLSLEQEFLLVMMKLRLALLVDDLAFQFGVSPGNISQTVITWVKLLSKELQTLIIWPSRRKIRDTLPKCFKKLYPKVRVIIDCTEVFFDTPSSLEVQACLWSDYKHH